METKVCSLCDSIKQLKRFQFDKSKNTFKPKCKDCINSERRIITKLRGTIEKKPRKSKRVQYIKDYVLYIECTECKKCKDIELFGNNNMGLYGKDSNCKICRLKKEKAYKANNRDKIRNAANKRYYRNHIEINAKRRQDRKDNPLKYKDIDKRQYWNNRELRLERNRKYRLENIEQYKIKDKIYEMENYEARYKKHREWINKNKQKVLEYGSKSFQKSKNNLSDAYIKLQLRNQFGLSSKESDKLPQLIQAKREYLKIKRKLKQIKTK